MYRYQSSSNLKNSAKELLAGKYGNATLITFVFWAVAMGISFVLTFVLTFLFVLCGFDELSPAASITLYLISGVVTVLGAMFQPGFALFCLNIACGRRYAVSDLFYCFRQDFGKGLQIAFAVSLPEIICMLPYNIFSAFFEIDYNILWGALMTVSAVAGLVIYIPISLGLAMSFYLMLDFPQYSAKELIKLSFQIMKGHKGRLFYIQLSFIPLLLLGYCSFGIALLWLTPYCNMTYTLFFLDLMKGRNTQPA